MSGAGTTRRFRPIRGRIFVWLVCGLPFALWAVFAPWGSMEPGHPGWWVSVGMAVSAVCGCVLVPALILTTSVTVGPAGLAKTPWWNSGFAVEWARVLSWEVDRPPPWHDAPSDAQVVRFRVVGWRREATVFDSEAEYPGFAEFLAALREVAGDREKAAPNQALGPAGG